MSPVLLPDVLPPEAAGLSPSGPVLSVLVVAVVVEVGLAATALWRWWRTPTERLSANRWVWLALIVLLSLVGPLAFLAAGRRPAPATDPRGAGAVRADDAVAALYGGER